MYPTMPPYLSAYLYQLHLKNENQRIQMEQYQRQAEAFHRMAAQQGAIDVEARWVDDDKLLGLDPCAQQNEDSARVGKQQNCA